MTLNLTDSLALFAAMALLAALPSVSTLAVASRAAGAGLGAGVAVTAGVVVGDVIFILVAMLGLAAMAETLGPLFAVVRGLGGAYLIWLGIRIWRSTRAGSEPATDAGNAPASAGDSADTPEPGGGQTAPLSEAVATQSGDDAVRDSTSGSDFLAGLFITLGDQKALLFYLGFLPAFIDLQSVTWMDVVLVLVTAIMAVGAVKLGYAWLAWRAGNLALSSRAPILSKVAATVLLVIGALLVGSALFMR